MDFKVGVVAIDFTGQQAFQLALCGAGVQVGEGRAPLLYQRFVTLGLSQFDQFKCVTQFRFKLAIAVDAIIKLCAFLGNLLGDIGIVPELGIFDAGVQF